MLPSTHSPLKILSSCSQFPQCLQEKKFPKMFPEQRYPGQTRVFYADVRETTPAGCWQWALGILAPCQWLGHGTLCTAAPTYHTQWPLQPLLCGEADREVRKMPRLLIRLYNLR